MTPQPSATSRTLACIQCQQRKVKCNRQFPCTNCIKQQTKCIPSIPTKTRRKRFPERELLACLRRYEGLLRDHGIPFEPLHAHDDAGSASSTGREYSHEAEAEKIKSPSQSTPTANLDSDVTYEPSDIWDALDSESKDSPRIDPGQAKTFDTREAKDSWEQAFLNDELLLFGNVRGDIASTFPFHPEPVHIFRLWQVYLDNVNPILKVVHAPSLQVRIIEAASDPSKISPSLAALMFGIYCMAVRSLSPDQCLNLFGAQAADLLVDYQLACQQALIKANFLRSEDLDCITALLLFLISAHCSVCPPSLSSTFSIAIRVAERMALHSELSNATNTPLTAEMRRRVWWALVLFDARVAEMAGAKVTTLAPTWNCKTPTNVGDSEIRADMKHAPVPQQLASDSIFAVVRSQLGDFIRNAPFHLDFTNPVLKPIARQVPEYGSVSCFEEMLESKYLKLCDPENPVHFMTLWVARGLIAKYFLLEHYSKFYGQVLDQTEEQCNSVLLYAFRILECDTKIMSSRSTQGFHWYLSYQFPFPAYVHVARHLRKKPICAHAVRAWGIMDDNYNARFDLTNRIDHPLSWILHRTILQAWEALQAAHKVSEAPLKEPPVVAKILQKTKGSPRSDGFAHASSFGTITDADFDKYLMHMPMDFAGPIQGLESGSNSLASFEGSELAMRSGTWPDFPWLPDANEPGWHSAIG